MRKSDQSSRVCTSLSEGALTLSYTCVAKRMLYPENWRAMLSITSVMGGVVRQRSKPFTSSRAVPHGGATKATIPRSRGTRSFSRSVTYSPWTRSIVCPIAARLRCVSANTCWSDSKAMPREFGRCRKIQNRVLQEPANGSITTN